MDKTYAPTAAGCPGESSHTILDHLAHLGTNEEHLALLVSLDEFEVLQRKGDLLEEGVAAVFGLVAAEVELLALCFHVRKFSPAQAAQWLAGRGIAPLIFVSHSGTDRRS